MATFLEPGLKFEEKRKGKLILLTVIGETYIYSMLSLKESWTDVLTRSLVADLSFRNSDSPVPFLARDLFIMTARFIIGSTYS